jgi:RNA polymerase sigma-70 factor (ECF subfamily)
VAPAALARLFADEAHLETDALEDLGTKLAAILASAHAAWPKIAAMPSVFMEHLARHARSSGAPAAFLESVHGNDLYLACAVGRHDRAALAYFEEHFMARVPEYVLRVRVGRDVVDEVQQKLRELLVMGRDDGPKIAEYSGKGALGGWLRVAAVRTALNHLRSPSQTAASDHEATDDAIAVGADPELAYVKEHARELLSDAFKRVRAGLDAKERTILRLHYIDGLTMDQLARLYKTPRSTIARRVAEARAEILRATESLLRDERRLSPSAVASLIRQAKSQLHVTISRLFVD